MRKARWYVRQLVPTRFKTEYGRETERGDFEPTGCVWWMWLGHSFAVHHAPLVG